MSFNHESQFLSFPTGDRSFSWDPGAVLQMYIKHTKATSAARADVS